jgi:asparagine synthase (glutamine-hydrolysing)
MAATLFHRGPDDGGVWTDPVAGIAIGFRRLAIIDLSPTGHQPMTSASGRYVIAFNGEVYNFEELRAELEKQGHRFRGRSDTEVILTAFDEWGFAKAVCRFDGMFAIALWDRHERTLSLARDPLGVKPLYYGWAGEVFLFGSELKAIRVHPSFVPEIDRGALKLYLRHGYVPGPLSIYRNVCKLQPGSLLTLRSARDRSAPSAYWSLKEVAERGTCDPFPGTEQEAVEELHRLLRSAVRRQMVADVPLGAFLSGGIDSSLVVALMHESSSRPVKTFTIGFNEPSYDEANYASAIARHLGTDHTEWILSPNDMLAIVPRMSSIYDEPFSDPSQIPTCLVSRLARHHVVVSLSGDGGDESFGGYYYHVHAEKVLVPALQLPVPLRRGIGIGSKLVGCALRALPGRFPIRVGDSILHRTRHFRFAGDHEWYLDHVATVWRDADAVTTEAHTPDYCLSSPIAWRHVTGITERIMCLDSLMMLPDEFLTKIDRASMAVSLESRVPLLDQRVVELAWRLPLGLKVSGGRGKCILREILTKHVPTALIDRPKHGFGLPVGQWLRGPLREWGQSLIDKDRLPAGGLLNRKPISRAWEDHLTQRRDHAQRLWTILMFQLWRQEWKV